MNGYENIYETLKLRLADCDFPEIAERLGFELRSPDCAAIDFIGRKYEVNHSGVFITDGGNPVNVNNLNVLAYYVLSNGAGDVKYSFSPIHSLSGMAVAGRKNNIDWMLDPLYREISGDFDKLREAVKSLNGVSDSNNSWIFTVLPKIPIKLVYYEADEEFPCEIKILFGDNSARFLEFECLAFLQGCFVRALIEHMKE